MARSVVHSRVNADMASALAMTGRPGLRLGARARAGPGFQMGYARSLDFGQSRADF